MRGENIKKSDFHDAGAIARCSYCGRYSDDSRSLSMDNFPCDCGKNGGWCGSFKTPDEHSKWSDLKPGDALAECNEGLYIAQKLGNRKLVKCFEQIRNKIIENAGRKY